MDDAEQKAIKRVLKRVASTPEDFVFEKIAGDLRRCSAEDIDWLRSQLRKRLKETPPSFVRPYRAARILWALGDLESVHFHVQQLQRPITSIELENTLSFFERREQIEQLAGQEVSDEIRRALLFDFEKRMTSHGHSWEAIPYRLLNLCETWSVDGLADKLISLWTGRRTIDQLSRFCRSYVVPLMTTSHVDAAVAAFDTSARDSSAASRFFGICGSISRSEDNETREAAAAAVERTLSLKKLWKDEDHNVLPTRSEWSEALTGFLERLLAKKPAARHAAQAVQLLAKFKPESILDCGIDFIATDDRIAICERIVEHFSGSGNQKAIEFVRDAAEGVQPDQRLRFAFMCRMIGGNASELNVAALSVALSAPDRNLLEIASDGNFSAAFDRQLREAGLLKNVPRGTLPGWATRPPFSARRWTLEWMEFRRLAVSIWPEIEQVVARHDQAMLKIARLLKSQLGRSTAKQTLRSSRNGQQLLSVHFECDLGLCTADVESSEKCLNVAPLYNAVNWMLHRAGLPERVVPFGDAYLVAGPVERILDLAGRFGWNLEPSFNRCRDGKVSAIESNEWRVMV